MDAALVMEASYEDQPQQQFPRRQHDLGPSSLALKLQQVLLQNQQQKQKHEVSQLNSAADDFAHQQELLVSEGQQQQQQQQKQMMLQMQEQQHQQQQQQQAAYHRQPQLFLEPTAACLEPSPMEFCEEDPLKDPVFNYISDMVTEEPYDQRTCMFIDCSGYQAMQKELDDFVQTSSTSSEMLLSEGNNAYVGLSYSDHFSSIPQQQQQQLPLSREAWFDAGFSNGACQDVSPTSVNSLAATSLLENDIASEEVYQHKVHDYLEEVQIVLEKKSPSPASSVDSKEQQQQQQQEEQNEKSKHSKSKRASKQASQEVDLCSLLVECAEALAEQHFGMQDVDYNAPPVPWWSGDLEQKRFISGAVRDVKVDSKAMENEKALREELHGLLLESAQAVAGDDITKAYQLVNAIRDRVSPLGSGTERMVFYFAEALVARITGTGALLYSALTSNRPPLAEMLKAHMLLTRYLPNIRISHYYTNQTILEASQGASRVHIVDYGILYGFQWPCLMKAFASRAGGPPHLRITGIDFPQPGFKPAERIEETGRKLAEYARNVGVPFEFHAMATTKWESVQPSSLGLRHDEVLFVNSMFRLRHLLDESVLLDCPRKMVLSRIRNMRPKVFIQSVYSANYNAPFFLTRFKEAIQHYAAIFEALDTTLSPEYPERHLIEQSIMGREILNVIACEGVERVERAESFKHWQTRTLRAGFEQLPLSPDIFAKSRAMLSTYHKGFGIGQDGNWLLVGWKDRVLHAMCTWRTKGATS